MGFRRTSLSLFLSLTLSQFVHTQALPNFDLLSKLELLQSDRSTAEKLFSQDAFSVWNQSNRQTFFRFSENIEVDYSTGTCSDVRADDLDEEREFLGPDVWKVPAGKVVSVMFEPKRPIDIRNLGFDLTQFRKERLVRPHKNYFIYFSKVKGIAVTAWGKQVESIKFFPAKELHNNLCADPKVSAYFSHKRWRFLPEYDKDYCVLFNMPSNVRDVSVVQSLEERKFEIAVTADDPENDVMTFIYLVTVGQITSKGAKAIWDLTGVKPGTYEIKVAADDGVGPRGLWVTKSITIN